MNVGEYAYERDLAAVQRLGERGTSATVTNCGMPFVTYVRLLASRMAAAAIQMVYRALRAETADQPDDDEPNRAQRSGLWCAAVVVHAGGRHVADRALRAPAPPGPSLSREARTAAP